jgi:hypothetical protein
LTLQLREQQQNAARQTTDQVISDDDLMALLAGTADDEDRARILHAIAHDQEIYRRWLELVEISTTTVKSSFSEPPVLIKQAHKPSLWQWINGWFTSWHFSGAALASAVVVFLLISNGTPLYQSQIDVLYAEFDTRSMLVTDKSSRKTANLRSLDKSNEGPAENKHILIQIVADGMQAGLDSLGDNASIPGVVIGRSDEENFGASNNLEKSDQNALHAMGRLLTLSYFQCRQEGQASFFSSALVIYQELESKLSMQTAASRDLEFMQTLLATQDADNKHNARQIVCTLTANIMRKLQS